MTILKTYESYLRKHNLKSKDIINEVQPNSEDIIFLSGSVIEGFSNSSSDLDVYVLAVDPMFYKNRGNAQVNRTLLGYEQDIFSYDIVISIQYVSFKKAFEFLNEMSNNIIDNNLDYSNSRFIELYHRFLRSYVIFGEGKFTSLISPLLENKEFIRLSAYNRMRFSENRHDDSIGSLESGDSFTAYISARECLEKAVESFLCTYGETNPKQKWLIKKINNLNKLELCWVKEFQSLYFGQLLSLESEELDKKTIEMIKLSTQIRNMTIEKLGEVE